jgi:outer membrane protein OmpA-like peptidoglycan-associated protein
MIKRILILVGFGLQATLTFAQGDCNKNLFTEEEASKLSQYGKELEAAILEYNPADSSYIAKRTGDFSKDLCGYTDEEVIKISNYLKELEKLDSLNKAKEEQKKQDALNKAREEMAKAEATKIPEVKKQDNTYDKVINFAVNSSKVNKANLDGLVKELKENKDLKVLLVGHTDASGSDNLNLNLSIQRANAVKQLLIKKGVNASRISIKGEGEKKPAADNETEEGKAKNRRVEISVK